MRVDWIWLYFVCGEVCLVSWRFGGLVLCVSWPRIFH